MPMPIATSPMRRPGLRRIITLAGSGQPRLIMTRSPTLVDARYFEAQPSAYSLKVKSKDPSLAGSLVGEYERGFVPLGECVHVKPSGNFTFTCSPRPRSTPTEVPGSSPNVSLQTRPLAFACATSRSTSNSLESSGNGRKKNIGLIAPGVRAQYARKAPRPTAHNATTTQPTAARRLRPMRANGRTWARSSTNGKAELSNG
mmetsp:Transcript_64759/g.186125  ORF Transcript_64759/g.186125 Transcript_64759/m.186125 type:complete len:201 (+) Transcript_64759:428-1030(+)